MSFGEMQFEFTPLGRNKTSLNGAAIKGLTMTVYDSRFGITDEVLASLDDPEGISVLWIDRLKAFGIYSDPDGMPTRRTDRRNCKQYSCVEVKNTLEKVKDCDFQQNFYRLTNGRKYGELVLFSADDLIAIKREARDGKH